MTPLQLPRTERDMTSGFAPRHQVADTWRILKTMFQGARNKPETTFADIHEALSKIFIYPAYEDLVRPIAGESPDGKHLQQMLLFGVHKWNGQLIFIDFTARHILPGSWRHLIDHWSDWKIFEEGAKPTALRPLANAIIDKPPRRGYSIRYRDGNRFNLAPDNLVWGPSGGRKQYCEDCRTDLSKVEFVEIPQARKKAVPICISCVQRRVQSGRLTM